MNSIVGLKGEVFEVAGQVAGSVGPSPSGIEGATPWEIHYLHPAMPEFPAWADASVGKIKVRINPEIVQAPYFRLFDCFAFVHVQHKHLPGPDGMMAKINFGGEDFAFWKTKLDNGTVVMVDTLRRMQEFKPRKPNRSFVPPSLLSAPRIFSEGQHRINRWGGQNRSIN